VQKTNHKKLTKFATPLQTPLPTRINQDFAFLNVGDKVNFDWLIQLRHHVHTRHFGDGFTNVSVVEAAAQDDTADFSFLQFLRISFMHNISSTPL
jgi:hypothetical protein